jgi:hypothetical protein
MPKDFTTVEKRRLWYIELRVRPNNQNYKTLCHLTLRRTPKDLQVKEIRIAGKADSPLRAGVLLVLAIRKI